MTISEGTISSRPSLAVTPSPSSSAANPPLPAADSNTTASASSSFTTGSSSSNEGPHPSSSSSTNTPPSNSNTDNSSPKINSTSTCAVISVPPSEVSQGKMTGTPAPESVDSHHSTSSGDRSGDHPVTESHQSNHKEKDESPIPSPPDRDTPPPPAITTTAMITSLKRGTPETDLDALDSEGTSGSGQSDSDIPDAESTLPPHQHVHPHVHHHHPILTKPLKGLLKKSFADDPRKKKKVKFSETMMVFCDDWPVEDMPQIIALKSPSDFSLFEVAASGYMFEPPIEYQDCLPFDPPPDYRDIIAHVNGNSNGTSSGGSSGEGSSSDESSSLTYIDSSQAKQNIYWESVILNDKEVLEEDAIIGVLKEDAILQAIGSHVEHHSVFHPPPVHDLRQEDFPIHYNPTESASSASLSNLSPSSSTSSLVENNNSNPRPVNNTERRLESDGENNHANNRTKVTVGEDGEGGNSISSPTESVQDLASDSSFTSQDTIIIMTKELLKGKNNSSQAFDGARDEDGDGAGGGKDEEDSLKDDASISSFISRDEIADRNAEKLAAKGSEREEEPRPSSTESDIGRFHVISYDVEGVKSSEVPSLSGGKSLRDDLIKRTSLSSESSLDSNKEQRGEGNTRMTSSSITTSAVKSNDVPTHEPFIVKTKEADVGRFHVSQFSSSSTFEQGTNPAGVVSTAAPSLSSSSCSTLSSSSGGLTSSSLLGGRFLVSQGEAQGEIRKNHPPKKQPPPPPAKPASIQRLRVKSYEIPPSSSSVSNGESGINTIDPNGKDELDATTPKIPPLPLRSGSVPNAVFSVSEIRKAFERGGSLDSSSSNSSAGGDDAIPHTKEPRPKSFPAANTSSNTASDANDLLHGNKRDSKDLSSLSSQLWLAAAGVVETATNITSAKDKEAPVVKPIKQPPPPPVKPRLPSKSLPLQQPPILSSPSSTTSDPPSSLLLVRENSISSSESSSTVPLSEQSSSTESSNLIATVKGKTPTSDDVLIEYTQEPRAIVPTKRTSSLHPVPSSGTTGQQQHVIQTSVATSQPTSTNLTYVQPRLQSQPVYLSLNRRNPHQVLTIFHQQQQHPQSTQQQQACSQQHHQHLSQHHYHLQQQQQQAVQTHSPSSSSTTSSSGQQQAFIQPPPRTAASVQSVVAGLAGGQGGVGHLTCPQKQAALCAQIIKTQQMMQMSPGSAATLGRHPPSHQLSAAHHQQQHRHPIQVITTTSAVPGQPPQQAIYGYIRTCPQTGMNVMVRPACPSQTCPAAVGSPGPVHYHHPQLVLRPMDQKLGSSQEFPNPSEIRRRDGLYAYPHVYQEPPAPGKIPIPPQVESNDELEQFAQQEKQRTDRIKQRYGVGEGPEDDPSFGFSHRPSVRGIRTDTPPNAAGVTATNVLQQQQANHMYLHRVQMLQQMQQQMITQQQLKQQCGQQQQPSPSGTQQQSQQQPPPPTRHVYLVRGASPSIQQQQQLMSAGATLPRNSSQMMTQLSIATSSPQVAQGVRHPLHMSPNVVVPPERPASSLGQASDSSNSPAASVGGGSIASVPGQCVQCLMQQRHLQLHQQLQQQQMQQHSPQIPLTSNGRPPSLHDPNLLQVANNNSLLTYKTISMPNVAMIRPIGPVPIHHAGLSVHHRCQAAGAGETAVPSPKHSTPGEGNSLITPQPRVSMSASAALSTMAGVNNNNNPDLVKDVTSRAMPSPSGVSSSSTGTTASSSTGRSVGKEAASSTSTSSHQSSPCPPPPGSSKSSSSATSSVGHPNQHHSHHTLGALGSALVGTLKSSKSKDKDSKKKEKEDAKKMKEKEKENKKSDKKSDKKQQQQQENKASTKEGVIYYSMNV